MILVKLKIDFAGFMLQKKKKKSKLYYIFFINHINNIKKL